MSKDKSDKGCQVLYAKKLQNILREIKGTNGKTDHVRRRLNMRMPIILKCIHLTKSQNFSKLGEM